MSEREWKRGDRVMLSDDCWNRTSDHGRRAGRRGGTVREKLGAYVILVWDGRKAGTARPAEDLSPEDPARLSPPQKVLRNTARRKNEAADEIERLVYALRLARLYVVGAKCKSRRYENIVADDTRIVDEALAKHTERT